MNEKDFWDSIPSTTETKAAPKATDAPAPAASPEDDFWNSIPNEEESMKSRVAKYGGIKAAPPKAYQLAKETIEEGSLAIPSAAGPVVKAVTGGLAYSAARSLTKGVDVALGYSEPETAGQAFGRAGKDFAYGTAATAVGEIAGKVGGTVLGAMGKESAKKMMASPLAKQDVMDRVALFQSFGLKPTPSQLYPGSKSLGIVEGALGYKIASGDVMLKKALHTVDTLMMAREELIAQRAPAQTVEQVGKRIRKEAQDIFSRYVDAKSGKLTGMVDTFMNQYGTMGTHEAGAAWQTVMGAARSQADARVKQAYTEAEKKLTMGPNAVVEHPKTIAAAQEALEAEQQSLLPNQRTVSTMGKLGGKDVSEVPKSISVKVGGQTIDIPADKEFMDSLGLIKEKSASWNGLKDTKTRINERIAAIRKATGGKDTLESGRLAKVAEAIDQDMEEYVKMEGTPGAWESYLTARAEAKKYHELWDKDILKIANTNPEDVVRRIVKNGEVTLFRQVQALAGEEGLAPLRKAMFREIVEAATSGGNVNTKGIKDIVNRRLGGFESETVKELMSPDQVKMLKEIINKGEFFKAQFGTKVSPMKTVDFLNAVIEKDNNKVASYIFQPNGGEIMHVARKILSKDSLTELKSIAINDVLRVNPQGKFLPATTAKEFQKHDVAIRVLFRDEPWRYKRIKDTVAIGNLLERTEKLAANSSQTSQVLMGSAFMGKFIEDLSQAKVGGMIKYTYLPWAMSKIYASEKLSDMLIRSAKLGPQSSEGVALFTKLMVELQKQHMEKNEKQAMQEE